MGYKDPAKKREYQLEWIKKRRDSWLIENGPCILCNSWENLEVDHIDPSTKSIEPARIWSLSAPKRTLELSKCQVLCDKCHLEKTRSELAYIPPHGTRARYSRKDEHKCRCSLCREASSQYERIRRLKSNT